LRRFFSGLRLWHQHRARLEPGNNLDAVGANEELAKRIIGLSAGPLPTNTKKLEFAALQTYSDGDVVSWIEPAVKGAPEPEHPAPTLTLTKSSGDHD